MKKRLLLCLAICPFFALAQNKNLHKKNAQLPDYQHFTPYENDWDRLIHPIATTTTMLRDG